MLHEIFRSVTRFPRFISLYISENQLPLGQCGRTWRSITLSPNVNANFLFSLNQFISLSLLYLLLIIIWQSLSFDLVSFSFLNLMTFFFFLPSLFAQILLLLSVCFCLLFSIFLSFPYKISPSLSIAPPPPRVVYTYICLGK